MYGGKYYMGFVGNLLGFPAVKKFWKSVKNWQSYCHEFGVQFFLAHPVYHFDSDIQPYLLNWKEAKTGRAPRPNTFLCAKHDYTQPLKATSRIVSCYLLWIIV